MDVYDKLAQYYDSLFGRLEEDLPFWIELAKKYGDGGILELGAGTGRVLLRLAERGFSVTGLDSSPAMLEKLKAKLKGLDKDVYSTIKLVEGNMANFSLSEKFSLIIIPFNSFQHLLTPHEQEECLRCVSKHLADNGRFAMSIFNPDIHFISERSKRPTRIFQQEKVDTKTGNTYRLYEEASYNLAEQTFTVRFILEIIDSSGKLISTEHFPVDFRWCWRWEMEHLLRICGFKVESLFGNYQKIPFPEAKELLIFVCRKA